MSKDRYLQPQSGLEAMEIIQKLFNQYRKAELTRDLLFYHQNLVSRLQGDIKDAVMQEGNPDLIKDLETMTKIMQDWTAIRLSGKPYPAKMRHFRLVQEGGRVKIKRKTHKIKASGNHRAVRH